MLVKCNRLNNKSGGKILKKHNTENQICFHMVQIMTIPVLVSIILFTQTLSRKKKNFIQLYITKKLLNSYDLQIQAIVHAVWLDIDMEASISNFYVFSRSTHSQTQKSSL